MLVSLVNESRLPKHITTQHSVLGEESFTACGNACFQVWSEKQLCQFDKALPTQAPAPSPKHRNGMGISSSCSHQVPLVATQKSALSPQIHGPGLGSREPICLTGQSQTISRRCQGWSTIIDARLNAIPNITPGESRL